jgi:hypothetical protein
MPSDVSLQPTLVTIPANSPVQIPVSNLDTGTGVTIINQGSIPVLLCVDSNFTVPVTLAGNASIPWQSHTNVWAKASLATSVLVLPETYNYFAPSQVALPNVGALIVANNTAPTTILPTPVGHGYCLSRWTISPSSTAWSAGYCQLYVNDPQFGVLTLDALGLNGVTTNFGYGASLNQIVTYNAVLISQTIKTDQSMQGALWYSIF